MTNFEWIPLSRKYPEEYERVLLTLRSVRKSFVTEYIAVGQYMTDGKEVEVVNDSGNIVKNYFDLYDGCVSYCMPIKNYISDDYYDEVIAWASLPEPYHKKVRKTNDKTKEKQ